MGYDSCFCFPLCLVNLLVMKTLRQQNRPVISYVPRVEPAPPEHAVKMDGFRDVWLLRGKYVAFVLMGEHFRRSPAFSVPEAAQRWAMQMRQEGEITS
ncbi:cell division activator CedA [Raoultella ornithinolytica]|uniref:Cell division modulator n=1 Tax=Raoultella ornithinolytica TaxID=54291 RepID=A0A225U692_RAOOR|nr:cell division activator CedA [Raoultella ornithinolytica]AXC30692.1 cell division activator CedA [Raoultella sp. X13]MBD9717672.1 cell division activator CedA [Raoultella sp. RLT01]ASI61239.1 cell division modulator [Raoultella ornithinolytica]ATM21615.1 cell division activator CedA [Raoultella ornithinolytica]